jgi:hypothetical protein
MVQPQPLAAFAREHLALNERFVEQHPHAWLVLIATEGKESDAEDTWVPGKSDEKTDLMCFELEGHDRFRVGSGLANEVVLTAPWVVAEHCVLSRGGAGWQIEPSAEAKSIEVSGNPVAAGISVPLSSGDELVLGGAKLTFLSADAFAARAGKIAASL